MAPSELASFCEREHGQLFRVLVLYTGDPEVARELAQEALVRACARWEQVRSMDAPGAWLHRVAMNLARSRWRRLGVERRLRARVAEMNSYELPDVDGYVVLRDVLQELPQRQREAVLLRHVAGLSVDEVVAATGASSSAVRSLTSRGLTRLRDLLEQTREDQHAT